MKKRLFPYIVACVLSSLFTACEPVDPESFDFIGKWAFAEHKDYQLIIFPGMENKYIPVYATIIDSTAAVIEYYDIDGFNTLTTETDWKFYHGVDDHTGETYSWMRIGGFMGDVIFPNKNTILLQAGYENNDTTSGHIDYVIKLTRVK